MLLQNLQDLDRAHDYANKVCQGQAECRFLMVQGSLSWCMWLLSSSAACLHPQQPVYLFNSSLSCRGECVVNARPRAQASLNSSCLVCLQEVDVGSGYRGKHPAAPAVVAWWPAVEAAVPATGIAFDNDGFMHCRLMRPLYGASWVMLTWHMARCQMQFQPTSAAMTAASTWMSLQHALLLAVMRNLSSTC